MHNYDEYRCGESAFSERPTSPDVYISGRTLSASLFRGERMKSTSWLDQITISDWIESQTKVKWPRYPERYRRLVRTVFRILSRVSRSAGFLERPYPRRGPGSNRMEIGPAFTAVQ